MQNGNNKQLAITIEKCTAGLIDRQDARTYMLRGILHDMSHNYDQALSDFNRAIEKQPDNSALYYLRAYSQIGLGNGKEAIEDFQQAVRLKYNALTANQCYSAEKITNHILHVRNNILTKIENELRIEKMNDYYGFYGRISYN